MSGTVECGTAKSIDISAELYKFNQIIYQGFFQDFLLGPFLQGRLSLAEQLGWLEPPPPPSINVVETQCVKAGGTEGHYKLVKDGECVVFLLL